jgi:hypothetical protein
MLPVSIGSADTVLLTFAFLLCGILLLTPKPVLAGLLHRLRAYRGRFTSRQAEGTYKQNDRRYIGYWDIRGREQA